MVMPSSVFSRSAIIVNQCKNVSAYLLIKNETEKRFATKLVDPLESEGA